MANQPTHQDQRQNQKVAPYRDDSDEKMVRERRDAAQKTYAEHEKENNPATRELRQYDKNAPGMHPANQPAADTRLSKGTRLDLEDVTGNPGHRGINPDAPATSMNRKTDTVSSINEPPGTEPKSRATVRTGKGTAPVEAGGMPSINEPPGSTIGGNMDASGQPIQGGPGTPPPGETGGSETTPTIAALEPDECTIGEESFDLFVSGSGFNEDSVIIFAGQEEPTDLEDDGSLSTGINMDVWNGPDTVKVQVKNGTGPSAKMSNEMDFTFHAEAAQRKKPAAPTKRKGKGVKAKKGKR